MEIFFNFTAMQGFSASSAEPELMQVGAHRLLAKIKPNRINPDKGIGKEETIMFHSEIYENIVGDSLTFAAVY